MWFCLDWHKLSFIKIHYLVIIYYNLNFYKYIAAFSNLVSYLKQKSCEKVGMFFAITFLKTRIDCCYLKSCYENPFDR